MSDPQPPPPPNSAPTPVPQQGAMPNQMQKNEQTVILQTPMTYQSTCDPRCEPTLVRVSNIVCPIFAVLGLFWFISLILHHLRCHIPAISGCGTGGSSSGTPIYHHIMRDTIAAVLAFILFVLWTWWWYQYAGDGWRCTYRGYTYTPDFSMQAVAGFIVAIAIIIYVRVVPDAHH